MKKIHLKLYKKWLKQDYLDGMSGLCLAYSHNGLPYGFLNKDFFTNCNASDLWWDSDLGDFNETRQNIVLLLAAQNGEL